MPNHGKKYRKIIGTFIGMIMVIFGQFMGGMGLNNAFRSFLDLICFRSVQSNPDFIILQARNSIFSRFLDFWTCPDPAKPTLFIVGDTRTPKKEQEKSLAHFQKYYLLVNLGVKPFDFLKVYASFLFSCLLFPEISSTSFVIKI